MMRMPGFTRRGLIVFCVALALSAAFGLTLAIIKGEGTGWRFVFGNLSAPYVIPPLLIGRSSRNVRSAVGKGAAAVLASLFGFYLWEAIAFDLVTKYSADHILLVVVLGFPLGAAFGLLGSRSNGGVNAAMALAITLPFLVEPLVQILPGRVGNLRGDPTSLRQYPYIFAAEVAFGCVAILLLHSARAATVNRYASGTN